MMYKKSDERTLGNLTWLFINKKALLYEQENEKPEGQCLFLVASIENGFTGGEPQDWPMFYANPVGICDIVRKKFHWANLLIELTPTHTHPRNCVSRKNIHSL